MSERFKFEIADRDLAFIKGLPVPDFAVKVHKGEPYILHVNSDHIIPIINPEDRYFYDKLYVVNVSPHLGYHDAVYADDEEEAWDLFADYCNENITHEDGHTGRRYPGFISSWSEAMDDYDEDEQAVEDFTTGPFGNEGVFFTDGGNGIHAEEVYDPKPERDDD